MNPAAVFDEPTVPPSAPPADWVVSRSFRVGDRQLSRGTRLAGDELAAMRNWRALVANRFVEIAPPQPHQIVRFAISKGFGRWDVLQGRRLNGRPLSKDEATALAAMEGDDR